MASIGHIAVGMAAARLHRNAAPRWSAMAWWSLLALLPDAAVIGFMSGVPYGAPWGHRGATHSLVFACAAAAAVTLAGRHWRLPPLRTAALATIAIGSHGLLDSLTDGGLGSAVLWPFDLTRYFAPWQPIPVAPIGRFFFSRYGLFVALTELVLFAPLVVFAIRPRRIAWAFAPLWIVAVWLIASTDPVRQAALGIVLREDTEFAPGFSEPAFASIAVGDADADVRGRLGAPLGEWWDYFGEQDSPAEQQAGCPFVYLESDHVMADRAVGPVAVMCADRGVHPGMTRGAVEATLGRPRGTCYRYTRSPTHGYHRARVVCVSNGRVVAVLRRWESS
jgi:inner membrane protein